MKSLIQIIAELVNKITAKQAFITLLTISCLTTGVFVYKDYNDTKVEIAKLSRSKPSSIENYSQIESKNKTDYYAENSKTIKAKPN